MSKYYIDSLYMTILNQLQNYNWSTSNIENIKKYIKMKKKPSNIKSFIEQFIQRSHNSLEKEELESSHLSAGTRMDVNTTSGEALKIKSLSGSWPCGDILLCGERRCLYKVGMTRRVRETLSTEVAGLLAAALYFPTFRCLPFLSTTVMDSIFLSE